MAEYRLDVYPDAEALPWWSQVQQYPEIGEPGISYFAGEIEGYDVPVDCLLFRDGEGRLRGILNHYAIDYPPWEKAGNVNVFVDPTAQRKGIGTALAREAQRRWGPINVEQQSYTLAGVALMKHLLDSGEVL